MKRRESYAMLYIALAGLFNSFFCVKLLCARTIVEEEKNIYRGESGRILSKKYFSKNLMENF
jgi:hypothetical protein